MNRRIIFACAGYFCGFITGFAVSASYHWYATGLAGLLMFGIGIWSSAADDRERQ